MSAVAWLAIGAVVFGVGLMVGAALCRAAWLGDQHDLRHEQDLARGDVETRGHRGQGRRL